MGFGYDEAKRRDPRQGFISWGQYKRGDDAQEIHFGLESVGVVESYDVAREVVSALRRCEAELELWQDDDWFRGRFESTVGAILAKYSARYRRENAV